MNSVDARGDAMGGGGNAVLGTGSAAAPGLQHENEAPSKVLLHADVGPLEEAYERFWRLHEAGKEIDTRAYCAQYPQVENELSQLLEMDGFFEANPHLVDGSPLSRWPEAGKEFLDFHILEELGRGTFARVYLATQTNLGHRVVAVKISKAGGAEAQTLGRICHPNIVPVHSAEEDAGTGMTAVCMPYFGSATLRNVLERCRAGRPTSGRAILDVVVDRYHATEASADRQPLPELRTGSYIDGVLSIGAQLADALDFIHQRRICHRDLKPSNVLMTPDGRPMLLDFNLSEDHQADHKHGGGTLPYMAPEQLHNVGREPSAQPLAVGARSDLFSLGVILYELLTGRHPFGAVPSELSIKETVELLHARHESGFLPLRQLNADVDPAIARVIESCLAQNPNHRPRRAAKLAKRLAKRRPAPERQQRWVGRHPWCASVVLVLGLVVATATAITIAQRETEPAKHWRLGQQAYAETRYTQAIQHFSRLLDADADQVDVRLVRARTYQQLGESNIGYFENAFADYQHVYNLKHDGRTSACMGYCLLRMQTPQIEPARYWLEMAIKLGCKRAEVYNDLAYCCLQSSNYTEAQGHLDRAVQLQPKMQAAHHNRAILCLKQALELRGFPAAKRRLTPVQREKKEKYCQLLRLGQAAMTEAFAAKESNMELLRDCGRLWAKAAEFDSSETGPALRYLQRAVDRGYDPKLLDSDGFFAPLRNDQGFKNLAQRQESVKALPPTPRIVDPG